MARTGGRHQHLWEVEPELVEELLVVRLTW